MDALLRASFLELRAAEEFCDCGSCWEGGLRAELCRCECGGGVSYRCGFGDWLTLGQRNGHGCDEGIASAGGVDGFHVQAGKVGGVERSGRCGFAPDNKVAFASGDDCGAKAEFGEQMFGGFLRGLAIGDVDASESLGFVFVGAQDGDGAEQCEESLGNGR